MALKLWDLETGQCVRTLQDFTHWVDAVALLRDGRRAISASSNVLKLWNLDTGECLQTFNGHTNDVKAVALLPDGRRAISTSRDDTLKLWDLETGDCLHTLHEHMDTVSAVALLPDSRRALSASHDHTLKLWDLETGRCLQTLQGHTSGVGAVVLLPDGRRALSGSYDKTLKLWDIETGGCLKTLGGDAGRIRTVALSSDGRRAVSGGWDKALRIWDLETGRCLATWETGSTVDHCAVRCCAADPEVIVAATEDGDILFLKLMPPGRIAPETTAATWHPSRPLLAMARSNGATVLQAWHPASQYLEDLARSAPNPTPISSLCFSLDGTRLQVLTADHTERILDAATLQPATAPTCAWASASDTSPDGAWRAVIRDDRLVVEAAKA
jgi:WD40 repeat protein